MAQRLQTRQGAGLLLLPFREQPRKLVPAGAGVRPRQRSVRLPLVPAFELKSCRSSVGRVTFCSGALLLFVLPGNHRAGTGTRSHNSNLKHWETDDAPHGRDDGDANDEVDDDQHHHHPCIHLSAKVSQIRGIIEITTHDRKSHDEARDDDRTAKQQPDSKRTAR